jgi:CCR4-NOT transcriptional regulation complex NOT5 subunit
MKRKKKKYLKWLSNKTIKDKGRYVEAKNLIRNKIESAKYRM